MTRWSLRNIFCHVSHAQFMNYAAKFKHATQRHFGTECKMQIRVLSAPKVYTTFWDDDIHESLNETNNNNTMLTTENLSDVTDEVWRRAGYVEVDVRPIDEANAPRYAFGHAEFKGNRPRQATFYIQPDGQSVKEAMLSWQSGKIVGDGFESNGSRSGAIPSSLRLKL